MSSQPMPPNTIARENVDHLLCRNGEPAWLKQARLNTWEAYLKTPMPTSHSEEWREVESLDLSAFDLTNIKYSVEQEKDLPFWFSSILKYFGKYSGIIAASGDKQFTSTDTTNFASSTGPGVIFCSIQEALEKHEELIRPYLETSINYEHRQEKLALMNRALFNSGAFLYIPANEELIAPFISLIDTSTPDDATASGVSIFPRIIVVCGPNSKSTLINIFGSSHAKSMHGTGQVSLCNSSIDIYVGNGAQLSYLEVQDFDRNIFSIARTRNEIGKDAQLSAFTVGLGGLQLKSDITTILAEPGGFSDMYGVVLGDSREHFSFNTIQEHNAPDTKSNITFKVALKDEAVSVYQGIIRVAKVAQRTNAYQSNKNLLLGTNARADSIPKLEILADDVKCSHGATVGPVDREQLFYLMSRGLDLPEAEELIVGGFFRQMLDACTISGAADWIYDLVADKIHGRATAEAAADTRPK